MAEAGVSAPTIRPSAEPSAPFGPGSRRLALSAADGVALRAAVLDAAGEGAPRGHVLLLHGRTEFLEKYDEVAPALARRGYAVASLDWRGQGGSARLAEDPRMGHVGDFADYQLDLAALVEAPEVRALPGPRVVVAHSMGGAIALRGLLTGPLREGVAGAVFSSPMWGLAGSAGRLGGTLAALACAFGWDRRYTYGSDAQPYATKPFEENLLTSDPERHARLAALARAHPDYGLGGPSWGWLRAATREMKALRGARLRVPSLVWVGSDEKVVAPEAIRERARRDGLDLLEVEGARHEVFFETPERRAQVWRALDAFLERARG